MSNNKTKQTMNFDFGIGNVISGIAQTIGSIVNTRQVNKSNERMTRETNAANREMVEMQNKAAAEQADLAYQRSKATNQVNLMQQAGMSKAGAINALNGGGSYTAAPVNVAQDDAPQHQTADLSGLASVAQAMTANKQMKQEQRNLDAQMTETKRQFDDKMKLEKDRLEFERQKWNDEADTRKEQLTALQYQNKISKALENTPYKDKDGKETNLLIKGATAREIASIEEAELNRLKSKYLNTLLEAPEAQFDYLVQAVMKYLTTKRKKIEETSKGQSTAQEVKTFVPDEEYMEYDGKWFKFDPETGYVTELQNAVPPKGAKIVRWNN